MFTEKKEPIIFDGVATIGGKDLFPDGIGAVIWSFTDSKRQLHTNKLSNVLYFTYLPVNIKIETALSESMKNDEGTWVQTKRKYSIFNWGFGKYKNTMTHSENRFPELGTQSGFRKFSIFCKILGLISIYSMFNFAFASICTKGGIQKFSSQWILPQRLNMKLLGRQYHIN